MINNFKRNRSSRMIETSVSTCLKLCCSMKPPQNTAALDALDHQQIKSHYPRTLFYLMVICLAIVLPFPLMPPSRASEDPDPGFFSKIFQNLRLSSAAVRQVSTRCAHTFIKSYLLLRASGRPDSDSCEAPLFHEPGSQRFVPMLDSSKCSRNYLESR